MEIAYSAPGRIFLSGEHTVLYGKPAVVSSIDLHLIFSARSNKKQKKDKKILIIIDKVKAFLTKQKINFTNKTFDFTIKSQIPIGVGMGSSAALCVAASATLLEFYSGKKFANEEINNVAYQAEKYFHKNSSGVDVSTSCFGGLIFYRKEFEFLKNISVLNFKISKKIEENLYLIDSGKPRETAAEMVEIVGQAYNKRPEFVEEVLNDIEKTTKRMVVSILKEDTIFFQKTLLDNQIFLDMLGVVSIKTKNLLKNLGMFGFGKVIGTGGKKEGSGFLLFYTNKKTGLENYLKSRKINFFKFKQTFTGVQKLGRKFR